jgi:peptidoglycan-associated lipoprotein
MRQIFIGLFCTVVGGVILFVIIEQYVRPSLNNPVVESHEAATKLPPLPTSGPEQSTARAVTRPVHPTGDGEPKQSPDGLTTSIINQFSAEPGQIVTGKDAVLHWSVTSAATFVTITPRKKGRGYFSTEGARLVSPNRTTTYTLFAEGPHGLYNKTSVTVEVVASSDVSANQPPVPKSAPPPYTVYDIYFQAKSWKISDDAKTRLTLMLESLTRLTNDGDMTVEGHVDENETGTADEALELGDRRAAAVRDYLTLIGFRNLNHLKTVSYGRERPRCTDATEDCASQNRIVRFDGF